MQLDQVLGAGALIYMERYVNEGTRTYSLFAASSEASPQYQPRSERASFGLVCVRVPRRDLTVFEADPHQDLLDRYVQQDEVLFLVHPETWASEGIDHLDDLRALPRGEPIEVAPTASTRTVLTMDGSGGVRAHFIKLHYPRRISRFNRRLRLKNIRTSVQITHDIANVDLESFAYFADTLGVVYRDGGNSWGYLVREGTPRPVREGRFLIPFFSLYGGDLVHPGDPPLLVQLIERLGVEPCSFVVDEIMIPLVDCWAKVVRERGILLESHAQNVLLEIDRSFHPRRIVHRDFDVWIDPEVRKRAGLAMPFSGSVIGVDTSYDREPHYSLVYDHFVGRELLDYLLALLVRFYDADEAQVRGRVAEAFRGNFPAAGESFPPSTTYYFSNEVLPGNEFRLVSTGQAPVWR